MNTNQPAPETRNSGNVNLHTSIGFALGFVGGLALFYLSHPNEGKHLKAKLAELYEEAKTGSAEFKNEFLNYANHYLAEIPQEDLTTPPITEYTPRSFTFEPEMVKPAWKFFKDKLTSLLPAPAPTTSTPPKPPTPKKIVMRKFHSTKKH